MRYLTDRNIRGFENKFCEPLKEQDNSSTKIIKATGLEISQQILLNY